MQPGDGSTYFQYDIKNNQYAPADKQYQSVSRFTKTVEELTASAILRLSLLPNDWGMRFGDGVRSPLG